MICTYIQETVLAAKFSHMKVPSQVSLINGLNFKQNTQRKNDSLIGKFIKNHKMVVTSLVKHTLPPPPS